MGDLRDRISGSVIASAVGDAMGAPVEGMTREMRESKGIIDLGREWIDELLDYGPGHRAGPHGTWTDDSQAGTVTDDTRLKVLCMEAISNCHMPWSHANVAKSIASEFIRRYEDPSRFYSSALARSWLAEYAKASYAYLCRSVAIRNGEPISVPREDPYAIDSRNLAPSFAGGVPVLGGLLTLPPLALAFPGEGKMAYEAAYESAFFDIGYAKDASGMLAVIISESLTKGLAEAIESAIKIDPYSWASAAFFGRRMAKGLSKAMDISRVNDDREVLRLCEKAFAGEMVYDPHEILSVSCAIALHCNGLPNQALPMATNFSSGRDTDCIAATVGAMCGAATGLSSIKGSWVERVGLQYEEDYGSDLMETVKFFARRVMGQVG